MNHDKDRKNERLGSKLFAISSQLGDISPKASIFVFKKSNKYGQQGNNNRSADTKASRQRCCN